MTESEPYLECSDGLLTAGRLLGKALVDEYITLDEANQIHQRTIAEVLGIIAKRIQAGGDDVPTVLEKWEVLGQVLEYLEKTE